MDRLGALRTFVAVARLGSFAEGARSLRVSATAASRAIAELEARVGVLLLRRTTRSVVLTPEGAAYLEHCRAALDLLDDGERALRGETASPRGKLRLTAPEMFGRMHIAPIANEAQLVAAERQQQILLAADREKYHHTRDRHRLQTSPSKKISVSTSTTRLAACSSPMAKLARWVAGVMVIGAIVSQFEFFGGGALRWKCLTAPSIWTQPCFLSSKTDTTGAGYFGSAIVPMAIAISAGRWLSFQ